MTTPLDRWKSRVSYTNIDGLSDVKRIPIVGKVRKGIKKATAAGKEYPSEVPWFVCPPEIQSIYGEKPMALDILFPSEKREEIFPQRLQMYKGPRLFCEGDGKSARRIDEKTGAMANRSCPCEYFGDKCHPRATLLFLIPKVTMAGCYALPTGSQTDIIQLNSRIEYYRTLLGRISFVPLQLQRVEGKVTTPDQKVVTKSFVTIAYVGNIDDVARFRRGNLIQQAEEKLAAVHGGSLPALPPAPEPAAEEVEVDPEAGEVTVSEAPGTVLPADLTPPDAREAVLGEREMHQYHSPAEVEIVAPEGNTAEILEPGSDLEEEVPFPDPEPPPPPPAPAAQMSPEVEKHSRLLRDSTSKTFLQAKWQEIATSKTLTRDQKVELQAVYLEMDRRLKGGKK